MMNMTNYIELCIYWEARRDSCCVSATPFKWLEANERQVFHDRDRHIVTHTQLYV